MQKEQTSTNDPQLSRVAVLPMDIRIEAVLYAQTRSFFVIPGDWFNNHSDDTIDKYIKGDPNNGVAALTKRGAGIDATDPNQARYPFYGQPIDMRITIYGAVSEAYPADIGAQTDWMKKWGWIPQYHGSLLNVSGNSGESAGHVNPNSTATAPMPAVGLSIVYNPQCGYPLAQSGQFLRYDEYGRPLPFAPRLPVCPGLMYSGQIPQLPSS
jgi:hypothetical protein